MTRTLKINEAFKNLIPPLSDEETAELQESLLQYGCRDAIVIWHDTIIDGITVTASAQSKVYRSKWKI